jgi:hypothetical protein
MSEDNQKVPLRSYQIIGFLAGLAAVACFVAAPVANTAPVTNTEFWKRLVAAAWLVVPPVWFFFELHWVRNNRGQVALARCKESQDAAAKVWGGVAAALALLYFK